MTPRPSPTAPGTAASLVEPGREPGHAHGVPFLGRLRGQDRRLPALLVRAVRRQDPSHARGRAGAHRQCRRLAPPARRRSPAFHHRFTTPSPTMKATSSAPMRPKPEPPRSGWTPWWASSRRALDATGLPIDLVVVSDHGMVQVEGGWITLDQFADLVRVRYCRRPALRQDRRGSRRVYNQLKKASSQFVVYRRKNVPAGLNYNQNPREGDPVVVATGPYAIRAHAPPAGQTRSPAHHRHARLRSAQSARDEGQLFCRRSGYSGGKDSCAI